MLIDANCIYSTRHFLIIRPLKLTSTNCLDNFFGLRLTRFVCLWANHTSAHPTCATATPRNTQRKSLWILSSCFQIREIPRIIFSTTTDMTLEEMCLYRLDSEASCRWKSGERMEKPQFLSTRSSAQAQFDSVCASAVAAHTQHKSKWITFSIIFHELPGPCPVSRPISLPCLTRSSWMADIQSKQ